jgi:hypothetical protein
VSNVKCDVCGETYNDMKVGGLINTARGTLRNCGPKCADKIRLTEKVQSFDGTPVSPLPNLN